MYRFPALSNDKPSGQLCGSVQKTSRAPALRSVLMAILSTSGSHVQATYSQSSFIESANPFAKLRGPLRQIVSFPFSSNQNTLPETCLNALLSDTHSPSFLPMDRIFGLINETPPAPSANLVSFIVLSVNFQTRRFLWSQIASHDESGEKAIPRSNPSVLAIAFTLLPSGDTL